jgi:hypothetical protein
MSYVLAGEGAWAPTAPAQRRADTALDALRAAAAYLRQDQSAPIRDDAGRAVALGAVLDEALLEAADSEASRQLAIALADYVDAALDRDLQWAAVEYAYLDGAARELELTYAVMQAQPTADLRRHDDAERARIHEILDGASTWARAGELWARDFGQPPPEVLLDELGRREAPARRDAFRRGAEAWLTKAGPPPGNYEAQRRADGWGVWNNQAGALLQMYEDEGAARAHYDALTAGRSWTSRDWTRVVEVGATLAERRRQERLRQIVGLGQVRAAHASTGPQQPIGERPPPGPRP